jgi:hypothetical protein
MAKEVTFFHINAAKILIPSEFRARVYRQEDAEQVACGPKAFPDMRLNHCFLYTQVEQVS